MTEKENLGQKSIFKSPGLLLATLLMYSLFAIYHLFSGGVVSNDGVKYVEIARAILSSSYEDLGEVGFFNVYSSLIAFLFIFTENWELSGKIVSLTFGFLSIISLYFFLRSLLGEKPALIVSFFYGISPTFVRLSNDILRETLFLFLFFSALLCLLEGIRRKKLHFFVFSCLLTFFSILTRLEGLLLFILIPLLLHFENVGKRESIKILALYLLFFLLTSFTSIFLSKEIRAGIRKNPVEMKIEELKNKRYENLSEFDRTAKVDTGGIFRSLRNFYEVMSELFKAVGPIYILLMFLGFFEKACKGHGFFLYWFLVFFFVSLVFVFLFDYFSIRHGFILGIPLLFWVYKGVLKLERRIPPILLLAFILILSLPQNLKPLRSEKFELKVAGDIIRSMGITDERIATTTRLGRAVFYSGNLTFGIERFSGIDKLREEMKKRRIRYLLLDGEALERLGGENVIENSGFERVGLSGSERLKKYDFLLFRIKDL